MSNTIRIEADGSTISLPKAKSRNPLFIGGGRGSGGQTFKNKRDKRSKDARKSWQRDYQDNG
jgi:hypothetical protein